MVVLATILIVIILGAVFGRPLLSSSPWSTAKESNLDDPHTLMSNGTHEYKKTVLLVSIDGLRADYLDRGLTPHLIHISKRGLRAEWMKPAFPSLTFPNHWTLMTGLHPESHGIIGNNFYDPNFEAEFVYTDPAKSHAGKWWGGEPVWETAAKGNLTTAVLMWPGPPTTSRGVSPTYFIPFDDDTKMFQKVSQIVEWLELPLEERPRLITVYEPSLDSAGHLTGPSSDLVRTVLGQVDLFAKDIHQALLDRNLTHIVDVIYVSDHGMTDTSAQRVVYLDEIIGEEGVNDVLYEDGWPNFGLRFKPSANASHYLSLLQQYSVSHRPNSPFEVYTHETMPERYHFSNNDRIAPIYVCPRLGWVVTNHHEVATKWGGDSGRPKGTHGYDNDERDMRAMFVADGPFAQRASRRLSPRSQDAGIDRVIPGFPNLELYGLVTKILGLTPAPNNGTAGFWDQYF
ncbi:Phosphodiest-domain-containing protein [Serendipita vermifera]|nr:Phosphodiest-domain-containing protein [Serendipita vermifera]